MNFYTCIRTPPQQTSINQSIKTHFYSAICRERIRGAYVQPVQWSTCTLDFILIFIVKAGTFMTDRVTPACCTRATGHNVQCDLTTFAKARFTRKFQHKDNGQAQLLYRDVHCHHQQTQTRVMRWIWSSVVDIRSLRLTWWSTCRSCYCALCLTVFSRFKTVVVTFTAAVVERFALTWRTHERVT